MGKIDVFHNGSVTMCSDSVMSRNVSVTFHNVAHCTASTHSGRVHLRRGGSSGLFPNYFGEDLLNSVLVVGGCRDYCCWQFLSSDISGQ